MAVRTEALWEAGKQAWTALRQLELTKRQRKLTGYWERKVADRICEFCLALQVIQQKGRDTGAPEVTWAVGTGSVQSVASAAAIAPLWDCCLRASAGKNRPHSQQ